MELIRPKMDFFCNRDICVLNGKRISYDTHKKNFDLSFLLSLDIYFP